MIIPRNFAESLFPWLGQKIIFIHTPKCGGSFINSSFRKRFKRCPTMRWPEARGHKTYIEYKDIFEKRNKDICAYTLFSVVRNPWSWHVSWFFYIKSGKSGHPIEHQLFKDMAFSDYIAWLGDTLAMRGPDPYFMKQVSDWLIDENGKIAVSHILRQESLAEDFSKFIKNFGLAIHPGKKKINSSKHEDYRSYYGDKEIEIIGKRHARDIQLFGYSFDKP